MPTFTLGQAAYVNKGTYSSSATYAVLNTVFYNGGTWVALKNVSGITPGSDATAWLCITQGIRSVNITQSGGNAVVQITLTNGTQASATIPLATVGDGTITVAKLASGFVLPIAKGGTGATTAAAARTSLGAQAAIRRSSFNLLSTGWTARQSGGFTKTITVNNITDNFIASPDNEAGWKIAQDANLYPPTADAANETLTFTCDTIPTGSIHITIYFW